MCMAYFDLKPIFAVALDLEAVLYPWNFPDNSGTAGSLHDANK